MCALLFCTEVICKACVWCHLRFIHAPIQLKSFNAVFMVLICVDYMLFFLLISLLFDQVSHIINCRFCAIFPNFFCVQLLQKISFCRWILRNWHFFVAFMSGKEFCSTLFTRILFKIQFIQLEIRPFHQTSRDFYLFFKDFHQDSNKLSKTWTVSDSRKILAISRLFKNSCNSSIIQKFPWFHDSSKTLINFHQFSMHLLVPPHKICFPVQPDSNFPHITHTPEFFTILFKTI